MIKSFGKSANNFLISSIFAIFILILFAIISFRYYHDSGISVVENNYLVDSIMNNEVAQRIGSSLFYFPQKKVDYSELYKDVNYTSIQREVDLLNIQSPTNKSARAVIVLAYHRITLNSTNSKEDEYDMSSERFKSQMYALKENGYETVTLDDLYFFMRGEKQLPDKSIVITFDDGIRSSYYYTNPVLKALNYSAVMFSISGYSMPNDTNSRFYTSRYYLNQKELTQMEASGMWEIEAHAFMGHNRELIDAEGKIAPYYANKLWIENESRLETNEEYEQRIKYDVLRVKEDIEKNLNKSVTGFAVPFGDFGQRDTNYLEANNILLRQLRPLYNMVFYQFKPTASSAYKANYNDKKNDFYLVMRIAISSNLTADDLLKKISAAEPSDLPYFEDFSNEMKWIHDTGVVEMTNNKISLSSRNDTTQPNLAQTYIDGSYLWTNYNLSARIVENHAQNIYLLVRFHDASNYVACKFTNSSINFLKIENGMATAIKYQRAEAPIKTNSLLKASVHDNEVTCSSDNQELYTNETTLGAYGGVGIRVTDFYFPTNKVSFDNIYVVANGQGES